MCPYRVWAERGFIEPTPGKATDKRTVALRLADICARFQSEAIAFDPWGITELERVLIEEGITLPPFKQFGQGYKSMCPATRALEELVLNRKLQAEDNPLLTWTVSNVAIEQDAAGNKKPSKEGSAKESTLRCGDHGGRDRVDANGVRLQRAARDLELKAFDIVNSLAETEVSMGENRGYHG